MAKVKSGSGDTVFRIHKWLGVNEAPEGDSTLQMGEAAHMRNWRITSGGVLKKRGGTANVAGLLSDYAVSAGLQSAVLTELNATSAEFTAYPSVSVDGVGTITLSGEAETVGFSDCVGKFALIDGVIMKFTETAANAAEGDVLCRGGAVGLSSASVSGVAVLTRGGSVKVYGTLTVTAGEVAAADAETVYYSELGSPDDLVGRWVASSAGTLYYLTGYKTTTVTLPTGGSYEQYSYTGRAVAWALDDRYVWYAAAVKAVSGDEAGDTVVRGIWSGYVGGTEVLCAACNGHLWQLAESGGEWSKTDCGSLDTGAEVGMFGFEEKLYILNGSQYMVWDGTALAEVEGYRPLVVTAIPPSGGGTTLEQVNKLNGLRRERFCPDGESTVFRLAETDIAGVDYVHYTATGEELADYTVSLSQGTVALAEAPPEGVNSLEIGYSVAANSRAQVESIHWAELFNGAQDTRVFIYGDGSNTALYSGIDENGRPRADYFPDMNEAAIGDENTPLTALIRHYSRLMAFKTDSAWSISYSEVTLADGSVTAGFYVTPVNRDVGGCAPGQVCLVENRPRTLDGRSVIEWVPNSYGSFTGDQRSARCVSRRVDSTLGSFDLASARTFYDKVTREYYVISSDGTALVNNVEADAWYIYTDFDAKSMINYKGEVYIGTSDGWLRHFSDDYYSNAGNAIDAVWESGAMSFDRDFRRKYSLMVWLGVKPSDAGFLAVTACTDRRTDYSEHSLATESAESVPATRIIKLKTKKFTFYRLVLSNCTADTTATVVSADIRVRFAGYVR
ncbi:MAG: hypothetical protein LUE97_02105 [Oscillospiraceae bacterium]|nr:hypothetical protein [Oscillospiraceae bacterium]